MVELIDVGKYFNCITLIIVPDVVGAIELVECSEPDGSIYYFSVNVFGKIYNSKCNKDRKIVEYEMEQFCKMIQGEI